MLAERSAPSSQGVGYSYRRVPSGSTDDDLADLGPTITFDLVLALLGGTALGTGIAAVVLPTLLPDLAASLLGDQPKAFWYLSRSSGVVAYLALWASAVLGLLMTS